MNDLIARGFASLYAAIAVLLTVGLVLAGVGAVANDPGSLLWVGVALAALLITLGPIALLIKIHDYLRQIAENGVSVSGSGARAE